MSVRDDATTAECSWCDGIVFLNSEHCCDEHGAPIHAGCCNAEGTHECETHRPAPEALMRTLYLVVCRAHGEECYSCGYFHSRNEAELDIEHASVHVGHGLKVVAVVRSALVPLEGR